MFVKALFITYLSKSCLQKHVDSNADITVSCIPMDDRFVISYFSPKFYSNYVDASKICTWLFILLFFLAVVLRTMDWCKLTRQGVSSTLPRNRKALLWRQWYLNLFNLKKMFLKLLCNSNVVCEVNVLLVCSKSTPLFLDFPRKKHCRTLILHPWVFMSSKLMYC